MIDLRGTVGLITGASSPTGLAVCSALAKAGSTLVMSYHSNELGATSLRSIDCGPVIALDVTDLASIRRAFQLVFETFRRLDFLVNIASFYKAALWDIDPLEISTEDWKNALDVDLTGSFLCIQHAIPLMLREEQGRIINFGSSGSMRGDANTFAYNAAKVGLVGLTKSIARAYAPKILANLIAPGSINTGWIERWGLTPAERMNVHAVREMARRQGEPSEVAGLVLFLLSKDAAYINGQTLYVDGGISA
jgi:NAD(P)-dependent dehydrogenase (short-subunit alcohol dehydrogenase family)